eukprot:235025_1
MASFWSISLLITYYIVTCNASSKIGVCTTAGRYPQRANCTDLDVLKAHTWYYNWDTTNTFKTKNCASMPSGEYVPMIWGAQYVNDTIPGDFKHLLGFNEPNVKGQSNMTPQEAYKDWKIIQKKYGDKILISPACGQNGANNWYDEFFKLCNGTCNISFLAVHAYMKTAQDVMNFLEALWNRYHLKIWLTEFNYNLNGGTIQDQQSFMNALIPKLESAQYVYRYSWFTDKHQGPCSLLEYNSPTSKLTSLGTTYDTFA